jgi:hypothetical protein
LDGAENIFVFGSRHGNVVEGWKKIQHVAVSQDQLIISIKQQKSLRDTLDDRFANASFIQDNARPQHRSVGIAFGASNGMRILLAAVARYDRGFYVPYCE